VPEDAQEVGSPAGAKMRQAAHPAGPLSYTGDHEKRGSVQLPVSNKLKRRLAKLKKASKLALSKNFPHTFEATMPKTPRRLSLPPLLQ
jgi:hypothetical protein